MNVNRNSDSVYEPAHNICWLNENEYKKQTMVETILFVGLARHLWKREIFCFFFVFFEWECSSFIRSLNKE